MIATPAATPGDRCFFCATKLGPLEGDYAIFQGADGKPADVLLCESCGSTVSVDAIRTKLAAMRAPAVLPVAPGKVLQLPAPEADSARRSEPPPEPVRVDASGLVLASLVAIGFLLYAGQKLSTSGAPVGGALCLAVAVLLLASVATTAARRRP